MSKPNISAATLTADGTEFSLTNGIVTISNGECFEDGELVQTLVGIDTLRAVVEMFDQFPNLHGDDAVEG